MVYKTPNDPLTAIGQATQEPRSIAVANEKPGTANAVTIGVGGVTMPVRIIGGDGISVQARGTSYEVSQDIMKLQPLVGGYPAQQWVAAWDETLGSDDVRRIPIAAIPVDAPYTGLVYGRQNGAWVPAIENITITWDDIEGKPIPQSDVQNLVTDLDAIEASIAAITGSGGSLDDKVDVAGDTMTGKLTLKRANAAGVGLHMPPATTGTDPASPVNGDIWMSDDWGLGFKIWDTVYYAAWWNQPNNWPEKNTFAASTATSAGFNIGGNGTAPSSPVTGDMWMSSGKLYARMGATRTLATLEDVNTWTSTNNFTNAIVNFRGSAAGGASINIPHGVAPSAPANGDLWTTTTTIQGRFNGTTRAVALTSIDNTWSFQQTFKAGTTGSASINIPHGVAPTSPSNGDVWSTTAGLFMRANGANVGPLIAEAPADGFQYARKSNAWEKVTGGAVISDTAPAGALPNSFWWESDSGGLYIRYDDGNSQQWVQVNTPGLPDANADDKFYGRLNGAWVQSYSKANIDATFVPLAGSSALSGYHSNLTGAGGWILQNGGTLIAQISPSGFFVRPTSTNHAIQAMGITNGNYAGVLGYGYDGVVYGAMGFLGYGLYTNSQVYSAGSVNSVGILYSTGSMNSTTASAANVWQNSTSGNYARSTSSLIYKTDVENLWDEIGDKVLAMRPICYRSNELTIDDPGLSWYSFGAEDLAALDPRFAQWGREVRRDKDGKPIPILHEFEMAFTEDDGSITMRPDSYVKGYELEDEETPQGIQTHAVIAALVNLVQRQQRRIEALEARLGI